jgi:hypothetical protein
MEIFAGSTPKLLVKVKDEDGVQLDLEDADQVIDVRIKIYNAISGAIIAKFYLNAEPTPSDGWRKAEVKTLTDPGPYCRGNPCSSRESERYQDRGCCP